MKTIVDEVGRIQLPEDVRTQLGVKPGDEVVLEERSGEWVLRSANTQSGLSWEGNVLGHKGTARTSATIGYLSAEDRDEETCTPMRWEGNVLVYDGEYTGSLEEFIEELREERIRSFFPERSS